MRQKWLNQNLGVNNEQKQINGFKALTIHIDVAMTHLTQWCTLQHSKKDGWLKASHPKQWKDKKHRNQR